jgi:shikimate dehydrogenase
MYNTDLVYTALHVKGEELADAIKGAHALGISGLNVTVPHKKAIMPLLNSLDATAQAVGAVNTIKYTADGYIGYNTDMIGCYYALVSNGVTIKDKTVLVLGAGGAANACVAMAAANGAKKIYIANRTLKNAETLAEHIKKHYTTDITTISMTDIYSIDKCELVLNATTLGFGDNIGKSPITDITFFKKAGVETVFDAIYAPWETQLLIDAASQGIKAINGFDMLVYQAVAAREIWYDETFDDNKRKEVRSELIDYYLGAKK